MSTLTIPKNNLPVYLQKYNVTIFDGKDTTTKAGSVTYTTVGALPSNVKNKRVWNFNLTGTLKGNVDKYQIVYDFSKVEPSYKVTFEDIVSGTVTICGRVLDASKLIKDNYAHSIADSTVTMELDTTKWDFQIKKEAVFSYQLNINDDSSTCGLVEGSPPNLLSGDQDSATFSVRCRMLEYFKNNFNLQIEYSNEVYTYSPSSLKNDSIMIANVYRKGDNTKAFHLEYFKMLYLSQGDDDVVKTIDMACSFLKDFCNADMQKLHVVSITENNTYALPGIEPFIDVFAKNGLREENIFIRKDVDTAVKLGMGDGYWRNPFHSSHQYPSFSILYPLQDDSSIADFRNPNAWLELCEASIGEEGRGFGMGVERLEYLFFSIPFPPQNTI